MLLCGCEEERNGNGGFEVAVRSNLRSTLKPPLNDTYVVGLAGALDPALHFISNFEIPARLLAGGVPNMPVLTGVDSRTTKQNKTYWTWYV